ncbi:MAG: T9SS type B sorting domain-containing protein [Bacteroidota bacterium]
MVPKITTYLQPVSGCLHHFLERSAAKLATTRFYLSNGRSIGRFFVLPQVAISSTIIALLLLASESVSAQTVLFSEDFTDPDGTTAGVSPQGLNWNSACPSCDPATPLEDYFEVRNNTLRGQDTNGPATYNINNIDASGCQIITFQFDYNSSGYSGSGNLECANECPFNGPPFCSGNLEDAVSDPNCSNCWDFLAWEINTGSVNNNNVVLGIDCNAVANGSAISDPLCVQQAGANPSDVDITITMSMWATNEFMEIDNVTILCYTEAQANAAGIPIPVECQVPCPAPQSETYDICVDGPVINPPGEPLAPAEVLFQEAGVTSVSFHTSLAAANAGSGAIPQYSGATSSSVTLFTRVEYSDGCVVIGDLTLTFSQPDGNAGNDASVAICSGETINLQALLGAGVTAGSFSDDDGSGVDLSNPNSVTFNGVPPGAYSFTYTTNDDVGTPCPPDEAIVTVTVTPGPTITSPTTTLTACYTTSPPSVTNNLATVTAEINGGTGLAVDYFFDAAGANPINFNQLGDIQTLVFGGFTQIFAQITQGNCSSSIIAVPIQVEEEFVANPAGPLTACDDGAGAGTFDLGSLSNIINGGNGEPVNFFFDAGLNVPIGNSHQALTSTVFATVGGSTCPSNIVAIDLIVAAPLQVNCSTLANSTTATSNDGMANLIFSGGIPPYTFTITGPNGTQTQTTSTTPFTLTNLMPGGYAVSVADAGGCMLVGGGCAVIIDFDNNCTLMVDTLITDPDCAGNNNGSISLIISDEIGPLDIQWSVPGFEDQTLLPNLGPGSYSVTVRDEGATSCEVILDPMVITNPPAPSLSCSVLQIESGPGVGDGIIQLVLNTSQAPSTIMVNGPAGTVTFTNVANGPFDIPNLGGGAYSIMVADANGCETDCSLNVNTEIPCDVDLDLSLINQTICETECLDVVFDFTGTGPFFFEGSFFFNGLPFAVNGPLQGDTTVQFCQFPDFFTLDSFTIVSIADANCSVDTLISLAPTVLPTILIDSSATLCSTDSVILGGQVFSVTNPQDTFTIAGDGFTTCDSVFQIGFSFFSSTLDCQLTANASGPATDDGSASITTTSDASMVQLLINGPTGLIDTTVASNGTLDLNGLSIGNYTVELIDSLGCDTLSCDFTVGQANCTLDVQFTQTDVSCAGDSNGTITLIVMGNQGPITVDWDDDTFDGLQDLINLAPGDYSVEVTDGVGCFFPLGPITINEPDTLEVSCSVAQQVTVPNGSDGIIELDLSGGTGPYAIQIDRLIPAASIFDTVAVDGIHTYPNLTAGDYNITIIDVNGCTTDCTLNITAPPCPNLFFSQTITQVACFGEATGSIDISVNNATEPISYQWTPTQPDTSFIDGLVAGDYILVVTDANMCTAAQSFQVTQPLVAPSLNCNVTADVSAVGADDGVVQITTTSEGPTVDILVSGPLVFPPVQLNTGLDSLTNLPPGDYTVQLIGDPACDTLTCTFTIMAPPCAIDLVLDDVMDANCSQGGAVMTTVNGAQGMITYDWSSDSFDGQEDPTDMPPGAYGLTVTDAAGCQDSILLTIDQVNDAPTIDVGPTPATICANECYDLALSFTGTAAFSIDLLVYTGGLPVPASFDNLAADTTLSFCGPFDLSLVDSVELIRVIDDRCFSDTSLVFTFTVLPSVTIDSTGTFCAMETVELGGQTFSITNPADTFSVPGGPLSCDTLYQVAFDFVDPGPIDTLDTTLCLGDSLLLGTEQFDASNPEGLTSFPAGGSGNCDSMLYVRLSFLEPTLGFFSQSACAGDTVVVEGRPFFLQDPDGLVVLEGAAFNGCDSLLTVVINFQPTPEIELDGDATICLGDTVELEFDVDNGGGINVQISQDGGPPFPINGVGNGTTLEVTPEFSTTYRIVAATSNNPCPVVFDPDDIVEVNVNRLVASLSAGFNQDGFQIRCIDSNDGSLSLNISEGAEPYDIQWSSGESDTTIVGGLPPNVYTVTITDAEGCVDSLSRLLQAPPPILTNVRTQGPNCREATGLIIIDSIAGGNGFYEFTLDGEFFQTTTSFPLQFPAEPGAYTLDIIDGFDCSTSVDFVVPPTNAPQLNVPADTVIFLGDSVLAVTQADFTPDSIYWEPAAGVSDPNSLSTYLTPLFTTRYQLTVIDSSGCSTSAGFTITVDERVPVYVPTAFSPNGDGQNDLYRIFPSAAVVEVQVFRIYDRWGNMMYEAGPYPAFDTSQGWDGNFEGQPMNSAVFVYYGEVLLTDGTIAVLKGDLVLVR